MVYFVGSEINQVGMAGVPELVHVGLRVYIRVEGWYMSITFLLLLFPEHFFITFFGAKVTKSCEK